MRKLKVTRLKEEYEIEDLDSELESKYVQQDHSLRDLADYININVTEAFIGERPFSPGHVYDILFDRWDNISKRKKSDLRRRLRIQNVDVNALEHEWIDHKTVKSYIDRHLDFTTNQSTNYREPAKAKEQIQGLIAREEDIIRNNLKTTRGVNVDEIELRSDIKIIDSSAGRTYSIDEYLDKLQEELHSETDYPDGEK